MIEASDVFKAFKDHRGKAIVIPTGTAGRHWMDYSEDTDRDIGLGGAMGHTTSAALGLALSMPDEKIALFDSEGSLLMNLGILATIAGKKPENFVHFLLDNGCYATTGGQPVPNSDDIDYAGMAKGAGYAVTYHFDDLEEFATSIESIMAEAGPVFVSLKIVPEVENEPIGRRVRRPTKPRGQAIADLRAAVGITD